MSVFWDQSCWLLYMGRSNPKRYLMPDMYEFDERAFDCGDCRVHFRKNWCVLSELYLTFSVSLLVLITFVIEMIIN